MRPVRRDEIIDFVTYEEQRGPIRDRILAIKAPRRVHVGPVLTFLFENTDTVRYQVQEMVRVERMVREADIVHEIETYNELLGGPGELGATLLIEIVDEAERNVKLAAWTALPQHVYALTESGEKIRAVFDLRQIDERRLSSVHYLKFPLRGAVPVAIGVDMDGLTAQTRLEEAQRAAMAEDLSAES